VTELSIAHLAEPGVLPDRGIHSTALHSDNRTRVVSLAMAAGEELSEHAASCDATLAIVTGRADLDLGERRLADAGPGTWVMMPAGLRHAVRAHEPTVLLLTLLKQE